MTDLRLTQKLKETLPSLNFGNLIKLDNGTLERRVNDAISQAIANIQKYPYRDNGQAEVRKVIIEIHLTPEIAQVKRAFETAQGQREVPGYEMVGLSTRGKVKSSLPDAETADVRMLLDMQGEVIKDVKFNPHNNNRPDQLEMWDDEELSRQSDQNSGQGQDPPSGE